MEIAIGFIILVVILMGLDLATLTKSNFNPTYPEKGVFKNALDYQSVNCCP